MIEHNQRNRIQDGLMDASEDDLIIIGDIDEIPNFENFNFEIKKVNPYSNKKCSTINLT